MSLKREPFYGLDPLLESLGQTRESLGQFELVQPADMPERDRWLLAHGRHMTVSMEQHYKSRVSLEVLRQARQGDHYSRLILLKLEGKERVVQFGAMRIDLRILPEGSREAVLSGRTPLGRVLIENVELRCVDPIWFARITPGRELADWLKLPAPQPVYGRMAMIYCGAEPSIELLEVAAP